MRYSWSDAQKISTNYIDSESVSAYRDGYYCGRNGTHTPLKLYGGKSAKAYSIGRNRGAADAGIPLSTAVARIDSHCIAHGYDRPCPGCGR